MDFGGKINWPRQSVKPSNKVFLLIFQMLKALFFDAGQRLAHLEPTF